MVELYLNISHADSTDSASDFQLNNGIQEFNENIDRIQVVQGY